MTLADCRRPLFPCRMIYRSSSAVFVFGRPPPTFLTAVPVVWNAFQARETTLCELCSYTGDGTPLLQLSDHSSTCEVVQVISSSHISRTDSRALAASLAREESNNVEQWRGKHIRSEDSDEYSTNQWQHRQKWRPPGRNNWKKREALLLHRRTIIPSKEGPQGTTNGVRGESPPLFIQGHQQGRGPVEKRPTKDMSCPQSSVPVHQEEQKQLTKDKSCPESLVQTSNPGGQVHTPCATNVISAEDEQSRSNPYPLRNQMRGNERLAASGRTSPFIKRA
ncbi:hypothetical protein TNCV_1689221 [Trichonephila clavipes]|nr:hypothetical protein TNCV_1689221 [Trichonephila clavipes]